MTGFPAWLAEDCKFFRRLAEGKQAPKVVYDIGAANGWWSASVNAGLPPAEHHLFEPLAERDFYRSQLE